MLTAHLHTQSGTLGCLRSVVWVPKYFFKILQNEMLKKCLTFCQAEILLAPPPMQNAPQIYFFSSLFICNMKKEKLLETLWRRNLIIKSFKIHFYSKNKSIWDDFSQLNSNNYKLGEAGKRRQCRQKQKVGRIWKFGINLSYNDSSPFSTKECILIQRGRPVNTACSKAGSLHFFS